MPTPSRSKGKRLEQGHLQGGDGKRAGTRQGLRREYTTAKRLNPDSQALDSFEVCGGGLFRQYRNKRSVWSVAVGSYAEAHFATFPEALIEPCIKAGCPEGGTVLDPFASSGTTGVVAERFGRQFIGIDLNPEYAAMADCRNDATMPLLRGM